MALDEVQRAPGLFPALKASIDRDRRPGRFLLTGSADSGLAASLLGLDEERLRQDPLLFGRLLETFVVGELRRQLGWSAVRADLHHFRTQGGTEVAIVLETPDGRVAGIEVKAAGSVGAADFRGLRTLAEAVGSRFVRGVVLYLGATAVPFGERLFALPVGALWGE